MATKKREHSESGFYHVCQRGVNRFDIFESDADRRFFMEKLRRYAALSGVEIHAWCLMSNHMHLLLRAGLKQLSSMMRNLGAVYARYFNRTHGRTGPLFDGRFRSVCVETVSQLIAVVRYIHKNPSVHDPNTLSGRYPWSSYSEYLRGGKSTCRTDFVMEVFGSSSEFARIHEEPRDGERHLDADTSSFMNDDEARSRADSALEAEGYGVRASQVGTLDRVFQDRAIRLLRERAGCSMRQIRRLTAVAQSVIRRALENASPRKNTCLLGIPESASLPPLAPETNPPR